MWISQMSKAKCTTYEFTKGVHMSLNRKFSTISNKSDFLHISTAWAEMTAGLLYLYSDLNHSGRLLEKWLSTWNGTIKSCVNEKSNNIHQVNVRKVKCITDKFLWYRWVRTESIQQSIWNKNDSFVLHELLWLICFFFLFPYWLHP